jgi:2-amino-4-hydroxy-6-hydroxymethyldihydropteridine diphosphokinase
MFNFTPLISRMHNVVVLLGANTGEILPTFEACLLQLKEKGYKVENSSFIYQSKAWGYESENPYYNQVLIVKTSNHPHQVLEDLLEIEKMLGRTRSGSGVYEDRAIDIDILFYDSLVLNEPRLIIPHPRLHLRNFCLTPLAELLPNFVHPVLHLTISELLSQCPDQAEVKAL